MCPEVWTVERRVYPKTGRRLMWTSLDSGLQLTVMKLSKDWMRSVRCTCYRQYASI